MTELIGVAVYLAVALLYARRRFAQLRAGAIDENAQQYVLMGDPVRTYERYDRELVTVAAAVSGLVWPLDLVRRAAAHLMTGNTARLSRYEMAAERDAMARRIAELEKELGL